MINQDEVMSNLQAKVGGGLLEAFVRLGRLKSEDEGSFVAALTQMGEKKSLDKETYLQLIESHPFVTKAIKESLSLKHKETLALVEEGAFGAFEVNAMIAGFQIIINQEVTNG